MNTPIVCAVPWSMIAHPHEFRVRRQHGMRVSKLTARSGLDACEAVEAMHCSAPKSWSEANRALHDLMTRGAA